MSDVSATTYQPTGGAGGGVSAWVASHKPAAAGIGAGAAVVLFALYRRHAAGKTGAAAAGSDTSSSSPTAATSGVAGLTSDGSNYAGGIENAAGDSLDTLLAALAQLQQPAPPAPPPPGPTAPRPGHLLYKIRKGDTLAKIAAETMGSNSVANVRAIRVANPILAGFMRNMDLSYFAGDTIRIPRLPHTTPVPVPPPAKPPIPPVK